MRAVLHLGLAFLATAFSAPTHAQQKPLDAPTEALVFKSGQTFLYREVAIEAGAETTRLRLPAAIHGTVWLGSDDVELRRSIARRASTTEQRPVTDLAGVLRRATGHPMQLCLQLGNKTEVTYVSGKILRTLNGPAAPAGFGLGQRGYVGAQPASERSLSLVVIQVGASTHTYPVSAIVAVQDLGSALGDAAWEYAHDLEVPVLDVEHSAPTDATARLGMSAMTGGLAWTPSYVLELGADNEARLVGKAVVVNDAEPLIDTRVRLVVGYPNLQFANVESSLLPQVTLDAFRQMLGSAGSGSPSHSSMTQAMSNQVSFAEPARAGIAGVTGPTPGEASEDLYLYDIGKLTLAKGERAYVPLLEAQVSCRDRYDWEIPDQVDRNARFIQRPEEEPIPLWHVLLLENQTDAPWTTAPILVQTDKGPVAQSMLRYTPVATGTKVKLTQALNLVGQTFEFRADDAKAPREETMVFSNRYEAIEVQGRIELTNRSAKRAPVRCRKQFSGDLLSADGDPEVQGRAKGLGQVNASRTATWSFDLEPGATWTAVYRYRVLIRR